VQGEFRSLILAKLGGEFTPRPLLAFQHSFQCAAVDALLDRLCKTRFITSGAKASAWHVEPWKARLSLAFCGAVGRSYCATWAGVTATRVKLRLRAR
jgi:hypothetical protein